MPSPIVVATVQSCILNATSNIIAQLITAYKTNTSYTAINWIPVFQFVLFTALNCPPNFLWQSFLESTFPSHYLIPSSKAVSAAAENNEKELDREEGSDELVETKLSIPHTIIKFFADQTFGASINTILFSLVFAGFQGANFDMSVQRAKFEFWPLMKSGWKLWPMVSLLNYTFFQSVEARTLVGSVAGMGWGIYLSLMRN